MTNRGFGKLTTLSDNELEHRLVVLLTESARTEVDIVAHLAEVETRRLHLKSGAESLFAYCQKRLNLSENQAFYRIVAARTARQFPSIFELPARGDIHLTSLALLSKYLTEELPVHADDIAEFGGDRTACIKAMIEKLKEKEKSSSAQTQPVTAAPASLSNNNQYSNQTADGVESVRSDTPAETAANALSLKPIPPLAPEFIELIRQSETAGGTMHKHLLDYTYQLKKMRRLLDERGKSIHTQEQVFEAYPVVGEHVLLDAIPDVEQENSALHEHADIVFAGFTFFLAKGDDPFFCFIGYADHSLKCSCL